MYTKHSSILRKPTPYPEEELSSREVCIELLRRCNADMWPLRTYLTHLTQPSAIRPSTMFKVLPVPGDLMQLPLPSMHATEGEPEAKIVEPKKTFI